MEKPMTPSLPETDSIQELAHFWDNHDLTYFEDELEEVTEPVFDREKVVKVRLATEEMQSVDEMASSRGLGSADLIREWVLEKIHES